VEFFSDKFQEHKGKILGAILGLIIGIIILVFGFFKTLFIIFTAIIGYIIGKFFDSKTSLRDYLDKILPPGVR